MPSSPLGEAKGILEALLGQDLITSQELQTWERLLGLHQRIQVSRRRG